MRCGWLSVCRRRRRCGAGYGEVVFEGDPMAEPGSALRLAFGAGVRQGSLALLCAGGVSAGFGLLLPLLLRCRPKKQVWSAALGFSALAMLAMAWVRPPSELLPPPPAGLMLGAAATSPHGGPPQPLAAEMGAAGSASDGALLPAAVPPPPPQPTAAAAAAAYYSAADHRVVAWDAFLLVVALGVALGARESIPWSTVTSVCKGSRTAGASTAVFNLSQAFPALLGSVMGSVVLSLSTLSAIFGLCAIPLGGSALLVAVRVPFDLAAAEEAAAHEMRAGAGGGARDPEDDESERKPIAPIVVSGHTERGENYNNI
jgi:hypothetical protein